MHVILFCSIFSTFYSGIKHFLIYDEFTISLTIILDIIQKRFSLHNLFFLQSRAISFSVYGNCNVKSLGTCVKNIWISM